MFWAHARPKTFMTPYTSPATDAMVSKPQRAVSPVVHPVVLVPLTVVMNTPESTTTPKVKDMIPTMKLANIITSTIKRKDKKVYMDSYYLNSVLKEPCLCRIFENIFVVSVKLSSLCFLWKLIFEKKCPTTTTYIYNI